MRILNFLLIFVSLSCFAQKIEWTEGYKLTPSDFGGKNPNIQTEKAAGSMISLEYRVLSTSIWTGKIKVKIFPTFDRETSWIQQEYISDYLLNHEQKHFDIAKIYADKLQKIVNENIKTTEDFNENFQRLYNDIYDEYYAFQLTYDLETNHGLNIAKQKDYDLKISELLKNCNNK
ncbi:DUF922 domain-containing protein [Riemerella anatipestifer]|uniref:DUF922 domain-containing protein n=2 Tax=Riemerella anatipestifer TaxID=34085 RepID=A0AAP6LK27_RIEAN|nr:DUF922 domain-containing protein [Riemerella anatipestifer]MBT0549843.1 DUF922 domain-containing protein [Riemerella anatipestifer]MBT0556568.1 DUF922 domain-containing protein [Riemerella anatipestifer]MBT0560619.1 DUF922 domain-containing protein [Riemerella anatipestifer]MCO7354086.1 DUF922 domain-containing Zn-dependent protease [Riemerella anatipestifer]MCU7540241.1 DUF922 domain-containing Zn-dependent protease [Riemerella anatipestifer]